MSDGSAYTRRDFLKTAGILGSASLVSGLWGFPGKSSGKSVVKVAIRPPTKITPGMLTDSPGTVISGAFSDYLFHIPKPESDLQPWLVKDYESSPDKKEWTFKLREGIKFHHGTELTSKDVAFTFNRLRDKNFGSPSRSLWSNVSAIKEIDKHTVRFVLNKPNADFLLNFFDYNSPVIAHDYDYGKKTPSGTGPFVVKKYFPGEKLVMERNNDYFMPEVPYVDELHFFIQPEIQTQMMMLEAGDVDILTFAGVNEFQRLKRNQNTVGVSGGGGYQAPISMRTDKPPFDDNRVRKAVKYCMDREEMLDSVLSGYGHVGHDHPIDNIYEWFTDLGTRERNIDKAKELLAQAGYQDGLNVDLHYPTNVFPCQDTVLKFQRMVKPAGINVRLSGTTSDVYYSKYWLKANMMCTQWGARLNVANLLKVAYKSDADWNEGHYKNPELDDHIDRAAHGTDKQKRQKHFNKIQEILREEGPAVIPFFQQLYGGHHKRVSDFWMVNPTGRAELRYVKKD
ncbi:twin-arginine translocation signal domain-containing protein [Candidatus Bipolaricaulota bacterium]|nr:twin-arginine translocation signal domain-containing protein [Candidatus Bipolaricaulota bacterium]